MKDVLYIVIPAYNESETIEMVVKQWYPIVAKNSAEGNSKLVIIDDGSKDSTYTILQKLQKDYPLLCPITKENEGHGSTVYYAYNYAIENGADYVFQTDSDGQTLPEEFEGFWNKRKEYDMIVGYRNKRKDGISRIFVTKILKIVLYIFFHTRVTDANTPYRLMEARKLKDLLQYVPERYFLTNVILTVAYLQKGNNVLFLPITFINRQGGKNSINLRKIIKIGIKAMSDFQKIEKGLQIK